MLVALLDDLKTQMTERKEMEENDYRGHGFWAAATRTTRASTSTKTSATAATTTRRMKKNLSTRKRCERSR